MCNQTNLPKMHVLKICTQLKYIMNILIFFVAYTENIRSLFSCLLFVIILWWWFLVFLDYYLHVTRSNNALKYFNSEKIAFKNWLWTMFRKTHEKCNKNSIDLQLYQHFFIIGMLDAFWGNSIWTKHRFRIKPIFGKIITLDLREKISTGTRYFVRTYAGGGFFFFLLNWCWYCGNDTVTWL